APATEETAPASAAEAAEKPAPAGEPSPTPEPAPAEPPKPEVDPYAGNREHQNAARIARVMVADLYLYNREQGDAGIANNDFYDRTHELQGAHPRPAGRHAADLRVARQRGDPHLARLSSNRDRRVHQEEEEAA